MTSAARLLFYHLISTKYFTDTGDWEVTAAAAALRKWKETSGGGFQMREGGGGQAEREMGKRGGMDSRLVRRLLGESRLKYGTNRGQEAESL